MPYDESWDFIKKELHSLERHTNFGICFNMIAYCGLNCGKCDAYIATKNNDDALREKTAKLWSELNHTTILPEHINCSGCRADGVKTVFCESICAVRKCAMQKGLESCGDCPEMKKCPILGAITANNPDALKNLKKSLS
ncbi:DUF3795 domain-containing protein [bacterium]|nr:DUF3795 domain-containing protein [bacterium]